MHPLVELTKNAVEEFVKTGEVIAPPQNLPVEFLTRKAGVFVTIEKNENNECSLRGCIGTYLPAYDNIAFEAINNAIAAAVEDYRFDPIGEPELTCLTYSVYILSEPELVKDMEELDPKKYGIIVRTYPLALDKHDMSCDGDKHHKAGLLLPDLEGVDSTEEQIAIACQKAGIDPKKEQILIYKFTAEKYND